jgi:hypothetical protein
VAGVVTSETDAVTFASDDQRRATMALLEADLAAVERALGAEVMP